MNDSEPRGQSENYDELPYPGAAYRLTEPDCLSTLGTVFGLNPAPAENCRVLELGCANGLNLVPMAHAYPESRFVGIDTGATHIESAEKFRLALKLENIRFEKRNILDIGPDYGEFDYVVCHGIFSWVPPEVQDKILGICAANLSPNGIGYVSYNVLPGWRVRGIMRDVMCRASRGARGLQERLEKAQRAAQILGALFEGAQDPLSQLLRDEARRVSQHNGWYVAHEYLADHNDAFYFGEFIERAAAKGLQFLAEAGVMRMMSNGLPSETRRRLAAIAGDIIQYGELLDIVRGTMFRRTLLCRGNIPLRRQVDPAVFRAFRVSSRLEIQPDATDISAVFVHPRGVRMQLQHPLAIELLRVISGLWPRSIPVSELLERLRGRSEEGVILATLAEMFFTEMIDVRRLEPNCAGLGDRHARVSPVAAYLGENALPLVSLRHDSAHLAPHELQAMLRLAGGAEIVEADRRVLAKNALLLGGSGAL